MTEETTNNKKWITCGVVFLILACLVVVFIFGGIGLNKLFSSNNSNNPLQNQNPVNQDPTALPLESTVPFEAVVQILALYEDQGELQVGWTGSGSIISPDGLILTNAHVVLPDRYFDVDALAVAITVGDDRPPEITYFAEVLQADEALDIAVIQIIADIDDNPIDKNDLNLPYVLLGESENLSLGDEISILGYPDIGGETITFTTGEVSGFTTESAFGNRAFIKTSATIAGGNSGGLATDAQGKLIGIPTQLGYGGDGQFVDCRVLVDTNRDGITDGGDSCIPTGGFINALRPVRRALPLIEAARAGQVSIKYIEAPVEDMDIPDQGFVLFQDDFSDPNSGWGSLSGDYGSVDYVSNSLQIDVQSDNYIIWSTPQKSFNGIIVAVDINVLSPVGDGEYGILCGYQDTENYFGLEISEDGYYTIWKYVDGEFLSVVDWQPSSLVPTGGSSITLTAACLEDSISIGVNGELLAEAYDPDFSFGDIGLIAGTLDAPGLKVSFDNLVVTDISP